MKREKIHIPVNLISKISRTETIAGSLTGIPLISAFNFGLGRFEMGIFWFVIFVIGFFYVRQNGKEVHNTLDYIKMLNKEE